MLYCGPFLFTLSQSKIYMAPKYYAEKPDVHDESIYVDLVEAFKKLPAVVRRRSPYVLFGYLGKNYDDKRPVQQMWEPCLHKLECGLMHSGQHDIERYINRGFVILDYWLPKPEAIPAPRDRNGVSVDSGWRMEMRSADGQRKARNLEAVILKYKGEHSRLKELQDTKTSETALKAKVAELESRLAKGK